MGVSVPLYDGVIFAKKERYRYVLTLDQDSIMPKDGVIGLLRYIKMSEQIGMVGSNVNGTMTDGDKTTLITSGTLAEVIKILSCGNYNRELFIDLVDYDISFKMQKAGYKLTIAPDVILQHRFGDNQKRTVLGRQIIIANYSPMRLFYQSRNWKLMCLWYPEYIEELKSYKKRLNKRIIKVLLFENDKIPKIKAYLKGIKYVDK